MPIDPEHRWTQEPSVQFQFPFNPEDLLIPAPNEYRVAAERLLRVLRAIDDLMIHSRDPSREWRQISLALGLPSCRYLELTEARIGRRYGITKMAVSKSISRLLKLAELKPNGRGYNGRY